MLMKTPCPFTGFKKSPVPLDLITFGAVFFAKLKGKQKGAPFVRNLYGRLDTYAKF